MGLALKEEDVFRQSLEGCSELLGHSRPFTEVSPSRSGFPGPL